MNDQSPMPFGKYKGVRMLDVPDAYCLWLLRQTFVAPKYPELWKYLIDNQDIFDNDNTDDDGDFDATEWDTY